MHLSVCRHYFHGIQFIPFCASFVEFLNPPAAIMSPQVLESRIAEPLRPALHVSVGGTLVPVIVASHVSRLLLLSLGHCITGIHDVFS
jgi:hypothetical protein